MSHFVYILKCADDTLYTGYTTDIERRVIEHNEDIKGAKYTKARRPVKLVYYESFDSRSDATKREAEIKRLTRKGKLELIK
ncbi:endonuclease [Candidatus Wolfebacteria bacterium]|nr:MAG: endonuclease [Candidatus Wolfebacteria bacterium]